jgi:hypothetical protein
MHTTVLPLAKKEGLKVQSLNDETLVFDTTTDKAYVLNHCAAAVWKACNGRRTVPELVRFVNQETPTSEQSVWYALGQLNELLQEPVTIPSEYAAISRRTFLKRSGLVAAAVTVPLVLSIVAPSPASAQSVTTFCCLCNNGFQTITGNCASCEIVCSTRDGVDACPPGLCGGA